MIRAPIAREIWACWSFELLSGSQPSAWIWDWSWDPLRFARRHPSHHLSPARQIARQGKTPKRALAAPSHHNNAPIKPERQSILSNIVALTPSKGSFGKALSASTQQFLTLPAAH